MKIREKEGERERERERERQRQRQTDKQRQRERDRQRTGQAFYMSGWSMDIKTLRHDYVEYALLIMLSVISDCACASLWAQKYPFV